MAKGPEIQRVTDGDDKRFTYKVTMERYGEAMRHGFYLEALLINGALIEDRLRSYLFHLGVFSLREDRKACELVSSKLVMMPGAKVDKTTGLLKVDALESMIATIKATLKWYENTEFAPEDTYLDSLWSQYSECVSASGLGDTLKRLGRWKRYRNETIHGLLHKHVESLDDGLVKKCDEGYALFRELDSYVECVSRNGRIRDSIASTSD